MVFRGTTRAYLHPRIYLFSVYSPKKEKRKAKKYSIRHVRNTMSASENGYGFIRLGLKMKMKNNVFCFGLKRGQDLKNWMTSPHQKFLGVLSKYFWNVVLL